MSHELKLDPFLDPNDPGNVRARRSARELRIRVARADPSFFCRYVLRDELTGKPIRQAPLHERWHRILTNHDRVVLWSHIEAGKTSQIAVGRVLYELGLNPSLRVCLISNTTALAERMARQCAQYIQKSDPLHAVFPTLVPTKDPQLPWKSRALTIQRPGIGAKDPSIQATGVHGNVIGSRIDLLVFDDILDFENVHTAGQREDVYRWLKSIMGRLTADARMWGVGNAWHPDDTLHRLEAEGFPAFRFPVKDPVTGELTWPERWTLKRIEKARREMGPLEYARQLLCQARDDTSAKFKQEWVDGCTRKGDGFDVVADLEDLLEDLGARGIQVNEEAAAEARDGDQTASDYLEAVGRLGGGELVIVHGVDLAVQKHASADETVIFSVLVEEDGTRRVLRVRAGRWTGPEIVDQIKETSKAFGGIFIVENNAAQDYIRQFVVRDTAIPIIPYTTGRQKAHPEFGIEGLAVELSNAKWRIPNRAGRLDAEVAKWIQELLFYDPKSHTGDRLMASFFAREAAKKFGVGGLRDEGAVGVRMF